MTHRLQRWTGIGGLIFVVLVVVSIGLTFNTPQTNASLAKITNFYNNNTHKQLLGVAGIVTMVAVVVGVFWFWYFREWLIAAKPAGRRLATVGFGGGLVLAGGGALAAGLDFTLNDAYHHATPASLQILNIMQMDLSSGASVAGASIIMFATGLLIIRYRALPVWLGWVALVFAVLGLPSGLGLMGLGLWLIAVNIVIILRSGKAEPATDVVVESALETA